MAYRRVPRGYRQEQFPLPHNFQYEGEMTAEDELTNSVILSILRTSEVANAPETIEVNPSNSTFSEDAGPLIHQGSIVPKISMTMHFDLTKLAIETDKLRALKVYYMPIYTAFEASIDATDSTLGTIGSILRLTKNTDNDDVHPTTSTNLPASDNIALSDVTATEVFGDYGLSTNATIESVAFNMENFWDAMQFGENRAMLRKVTGPMRHVTLLRDRPFNYYTNNLTSPIVKRGNPFTFCGMLIHIPQVSQIDQYSSAGSTTNIGHVEMKATVRFDEWNPNFDQTAF